jgi:hypothetical protein
VAQLYQVLGTEPPAAAAAPKPKPKTTPPPPPPPQARPYSAAAAAAAAAADAYNAASKPAGRSMTASGAVLTEEPPALTDLIRRALAQCASEADRVYVNGELQKIVARVIAQGLMAVYDWSAERLPIPPSHSTTALAAFIKRAFATCVFDADRLYMNGVLQTLVAKVTADGRLAVHPWGNEPLPVIPHHVAAGERRKLKEAAATAAASKKRKLQSINNAAAAAAVPLKVPKATPPGEIQIVCNLCKNGRKFGSASALRQHTEAKHKK